MSEFQIESPFIPPRISSEIDLEFSLDICISSDTSFVDINSTLLFKLFFCVPFLFEYLILCSLKLVVLNNASSPQIDQYSP